MKEHAFLFEKILIPDGTYCTKLTIKEKRCHLLVHKYVLRTLTARTTRPYILLLEFIFNY